MSGPCPLWGPFSLQYLLQGQHSRACAIQEIPGEHRWQLLELHGGTKEERCSARFHTSKEGLVGNVKVKRAPGHVRDTNGSFFFLFFFFFFFLLFLSFLIYFPILTILHTLTFHYTLLSFPLYLPFLSFLFLW